MKLKFRKLSLVFATLLLTTTANAQLLTLHVANEHTRDNMSVSWSPDYDKLDDEMCEMEDDGNGNYKFSADIPEQFNWVYLEIFGSNRPLVIEKGKTIDVTVTGGSAPSYNIVGDNRDASLYLKRLDLAISKEAITSYGVDESKAKKDSRLNVLASTIAPLKSQLANIEPEETRSFVSRITDMYETYYRLSIIGGGKSADALYNLGSADYDKAMEDVKVNDPVYMRYCLNERYIRNKMTKEDYGDGSDLTDYGIKFIEKMKEAGITNKLVKHSLLDHLASLVLYQSHPKDVKTFWKPFADYASDDKPLLDKYSGKMVNQQIVGDEDNF